MRRMRRFLKIINNIFKVIKSDIKRGWRKLKYLDKTQFNYFVVTSFIGAFCLFTGTTYSAFTLSRYLNAATITIAKLNYTLSSSTSGYSNGTISVPAGETVYVDLTLDSLNSATTRYALNYTSTNSSSTAYYSHNLGNNVEGTIAASGQITMRIVLTNTGASADTVTFTISGGYVQNSLTSNITEGFYEQDVVVRTTLYDANFANPTSVSSFPSSSSGYAYYKTECTETVTANWDNDNWYLDLDNMGQQVACDVYFKQLSTNYDIEIWYKTTNESGVTTLSSTPPSSSSGLSYLSTTCSTGSATWNDSTRTLSVTGTTGQTLCVAEFGIKTSPYTVISQAGSSLTTGDKIAIGDENFWVISNTNGTIRALAEYNINVGDNKNPNVAEGLQDESVRGYWDGHTTYGNVAFSNNGTSYSGSLLEGYINDYIDKLESEYAVSGISGDALTLSEFETLGCSSIMYNCDEAPSWVYTTSYWLGSVNSYDYVWNVDSDSYSGDHEYYEDSNFGVRPVVVISES